MEKYGVVYKVTREEDGKIYIGQTRNSIEKRMSWHLKQGYKYFEKMIKHKDFDFNENLFPVQYYLDDGYGYDIEIIDDAFSPEQLNEKETYWINYYFDNNYNMFNILKTASYYSFKSPKYYDGSVDSNSFLYNNSSYKISKCYKEKQEEEFDD